MDPNPFLDTRQCSVPARPQCVCPIGTNTLLHTHTRRVCARSNRHESGLVSSAYFCISLWANILLISSRSNFQSLAIESLSILVVFLTTPCSPLSQNSWIAFRSVWFDDFDIIVRYSAKPHFHILMMARIFGSTPS